MSPSLCRIGCENQYRKVVRAPRCQSYSLTETTVSWEQLCLPTRQCTTSYSQKNTEFLGDPDGPLLAKELWASFQSCSQSFLFQHLGALEGRGQCHKPCKFEVLEGSNKESMEENGCCPHFENIPFIYGPYQPSYPMWRQAH